MSWLSLLRRVWQLWKLHKTKFVLCKECSMPLTPEEMKHGTGTYCTEHREEYKASFRLPGVVQGAYSTLLAPGLREAFGGIGNVLGGLSAGASAAMQNAQMNQQRQLNMQEQLRNMQMNQQQWMIEADKRTGLINGQLGSIQNGASQQVLQQLLGGLQLPSHDEPS